MGAPYSGSGNSFILKHGIEQASCPDQDVEASADTPSAPGPSPEALEKQKILARLKRFRTTSAPGSLSIVAQRCGRGITAETLRGVLIGESVLNIAEWRRIDRALDKLHFELPEEAADG